MDYLESVRLLREIEEKFDVMSVKYKGITVWPYVRVYLVDSLSAHRAQKASANNVVFILKHLFDNNSLSLFKKHKIWLYDGDGSLRLIDGKYIHQTSGPIFEIDKKTLLLANPSFSAKNMDSAIKVEGDSFSNSWCIMISRALTILSPKKLMKIENEEVLIEINKYLNVKFDYRYYIKHLFSQKRAVDLMLFIGRKPKMVFMICPYAQMGYLLSYHNHKIPVIELQHGVLNSSHYAYNSIYPTALLHPDEICVYGEEEYKYFTEVQKNYVPKVTITGLYILEMTDKYSNKDVYEEYRKKYKHIIFVAGQPNTEQILADFIDEVARKTPETLYVYKPRQFNERVELKSSNVLLVGNVNTYEYLKWCDIHTTISSTTCLEAHYFKRPIIFYDHGKRASGYYKTIMNEKNGAYYVNEVDEYIKAMEEALCNHYVFKTLFANNCIERFKEVVSRYDC